MKEYLVLGYKGNATFLTGIYIDATSKPDAFNRVKENFDLEIVLIFTPSQVRDAKKIW